MKHGGRFWTLQTSILVLVGVLLFLLTLFGPGDDSRDGLSVLPSTFLNETTGLRALYLAAEELGISVKRWMLPFPQFEDVEEEDVGSWAMAIVAPTERLLPSEARSVLEWVKAGGRLLYAPVRHEKDELLEALGIDRPSPGAIGGLPIPDRTRRWPAQAPRAPVQRAAVQRASSGPGGAPLSEEAMRLLEGTPDRVHGFRERIEIPGGAELQAEPLLTGDGASSPVASAAVALLRAGKGRIVLFADHSVLTNEWLRESAAAPLVLRSLAFLAAGETLYFDEFHHGFDERGGVERALWSFLSKTNEGWAVLQAASIALAALFFAGIRFGRPLPPPPHPRRSSLEHVEALARAYGETRPEGRLSSILAEGLRHKLGARSREELEARLRAIEQSRPELRESVEIILGRAAPPKLARRPRALLPVAEAIDRVLAEEGGHARS